MTAVFALIGAIEILNLIFHKVRCKTVKTYIFSIIPLKGDVYCAEYILKALKQELCWLKNGCGKLIVLNLGLSEKSEETIRKIQGVELLNKEELYPLFEEELWKKN